MTFPKRLCVVCTGVMAVAILVAATTLVAQPGCTNSCSIPCPPTSVYIGTLDNTQVAIDQIYFAGPACPPAYGLPCTASGGGCSYFTVTGQKPGSCDVAIAFHDRPAEIVHLEFGPHVTGDCCQGYPVVGDSTFLIPDNPDAGIMGATGGTDAVTIVVDAAASDGPDAGDAGDAGDDRPEASAD